MVTELRDEAIKAGKALAVGLDMHGIPIRVAMWNYDSDAERWMLILATPLVTTRGPLAVYQAIQEHLKNNTAIHFEDISVVEPSDDDAAAVRKAESLTADSAPVRLTVESVYGGYFDDLWVLLSQANPPKPRLRA